MPDVFSPEKRSAVMSLIRGFDNLSTELRLRSLMRASGIKGWRRKSKITGRPDFVFPKQRVAIFVDGCFWHGCPAHYRPPKGNSLFWKTKIEKNRSRDEQVNTNLAAAGWTVVRLWEHELSRSLATATVARIRSTLSMGPSSLLDGRVKGK